MGRNKFLHFHVIPENCERHHKRKATDSCKRTHTLSQYTGPIPNKKEIPSLFQDEAANSETKVSLPSVEVHRGEKKKIKLSTPFLNIEIITD